MTLDQSDHLDWLALPRVRGNRVSKRGDRYLYRGQPFPPVSLVAVALHGLEQAGMVTLVVASSEGSRLLRSVRNRLLAIAAIFSRSLDTGGLVHREERTGQERPCH